MMSRIRKDAKTVTMQHTKRSTPVHATHAIALTHVALCRAITVSLFVSFSFDFIVFLQHSQFY